MMNMLLIFFMAGAQPVDIRAPFKSDAEVLTQQGSLFKVALARGEPIKIFVLGKKQAEIDLSTSALDFEVNPTDFSIQVRRVGPKLSKIIRVEKQKNYFIIADPENNDPVYTLEVTTQVKGKKEKFNFKIDNRPK